MTPSPQRIAVVGSGVAGLTAAYVASRTAHVTLFEADERLGGHADTHVVREGDRELAIDTGFIVHNPRTYPVLLRLFAELGVVTQPSEMSMSIRDDGTGLQWAGALGRQGRLPHGREPAQPALPAVAHRDPEVPPASAPAAGLRRCGPHPARLPRAGAVHGVLPPPLHGASRRRRVVVRPRGGARLPGALPVHVPRAPRDARRLRQPAVANGDRWLAGGTSPRWPRGFSEVRTGAKVTSVLETSDGVEVTDGNGDGARLRRRRHRDPPGPGAGDARRADRHAARRAHRHALLAEHRAPAHRHLGVAAARGTPGRRGTSPGAPAPRSRCWSPTT